MKNKLVKRKIIAATISVVIYISLIYSQDCNEGYTYYSELPETAVITLGEPCLSNIDLSILNDIISENNLDYPDPINIGNQTWKDGRLNGLVASYTPNGGNGINAQLTSLPESIGNLSELAFLYLEWNILTYLPNSFSQLTSLVSLTINNNWLTGLPSNFGNLNQLYFLDLGYNQLLSVPESFCQLGSLQYLYLFNNQLYYLPGCICDLVIDWNGFDGGDYPFFGIGANFLCDDVPECVENSQNFELSLDQIYYSIHLVAPQECCPEMGDINSDGGHNVLDIVALVNCVLADNCSGCEGDMNGDGGYNILDIVALANCVLAVNCSD
tara:strand:+ start:139 stop:1116 length:978 start_codon:yes stop_codon:yes gene_type:complete